MELGKGLSGKVNYNLKIKGRRVSVIKVEERILQKEVACARSLRLKKKKKSRNFTKAITADLAPNKKEVTR